jgi:hypothetical protein
MISPLSSTTSGSPPRSTDTRRVPGSRYERSPQACPPPTSCCTRHPSTSMTRTPGGCRRSTADDSSDSSTGGETRTPSSLSCGWSAPPPRSSTACDRSPGGRATVPTHLLPRVEMPTPVLYGDASPPWMLGVAQQLVGRLRDASLEILAGQEHVVQADVLAPVLDRSLAVPSGRSDERSVQDRHARVGVAGSAGGVPWRDCSSASTASRGAGAGPLRSGRLPRPSGKRSVASRPCRHRLGPDALGEGRAARRGRVSPFGTRGA